jgi:hypothetical protein
VKVYSSPWFFVLISSAIYFSFFFFWRTASSSAISAFVLRKFLVRWIEFTYSSMFFSCFYSDLIALGELLDPI